MNIFAYIKEQRLTIAGALLGALAGWLYWYNIGCASGTCAITSSPVNSSIYGLFTGGLLFSTFKKNDKGKD